MVDTTAGGGLPTPAQMRTFLEASQAAWYARRMREASRAVITGNIALAICMLGTVLVVMHSQRVRTAGPFLACGLVFGDLAVMFFSLRWMKRQRAQSLVTVVDRREEEVSKAIARPWRAAAVLCALLVFQAVSVIGWSIGLQYMSNGAILASLSITPLIGILFFVRRYMVFRFWEDLLFAGCVALAFAPFFLRTWDLTPLSLLSLLLVIPGTVSLHCRWAVWSRSLADMEGEDSPEEVRS
jgi:hypothetical protein